MQTRTRAWVSFAVRAAIAAGALAWTLSRVSVSELVRAASRMQPWTFAAAFAICLAGFAVGSLRWQSLLRAYGARRVPSTATLTRRYLESSFYNTFLPGNVGGDLVRAHTTRDLFESPVSAYMIVAIERVFGLAGLLMLASMLLTIHPLSLPSDVRWLGLVGIALSCACVVAPMALRHVPMPGRIGAALLNLPACSRPSWLVPVVVCSMITHALTAVVGYLFFSTLEASVSLVEALTLVPVALASIYFPTIAGLGVREAAFVVVFGTLGVRAADATAASLGLFSAQLGIALFGGVLHVVAGSKTVRDAPESTTAQ